MARTWIDLGYIPDRIVLTSAHNMDNESHPLGNHWFFERLHVWDELEYNYNSLYEDYTYDETIEDVVGRVYSSIRDDFIDIEKTIDVDHYVDPKGYLTMDVTYIQVQFSPLTYNEIAATGIVPYTWLIVDIRFLKPIPKAECDIYIKKSNVNAFNVENLIVDLYVGSHVYQQQFDSSYNNLGLYFVFPDFFWDNKINCIELPKLPI